jgi:hypothetical protein
LVPPEASQGFSVTFTDYGGKRENLRRVTRGGGRETKFCDAQIGGGFPRSADTVENVAVWLFQFPREKIDLSDRPTSRSRKSEVLQPRRASLHLARRNA